MNAAGRLAIIHTASLLGFGLGSAAVQAQANALPSQVSPADTAMNPLMEAWLKASNAQLRWQRGGNDAAIGALMFEQVDLAPMSRAPRPTELAPYAHQFAGDMMKTPVLVQAGSRGEKPVFLAVNKRPDSPLPSQVLAFVPQYSMAVLVICNIAIDADFGIKHLEDCR